MMKKTIAFILSIAVFLSSGLFRFSVGAETTVTGSSGDCTWSLDGTELTISGDGAMEDYPSSSVAPWRTAVTKVIIEEGVTNIGENAFGSCTRLESITIPDSVTSIGRSAFSGCNNLESITIPDGVTNIGEYAFWMCVSLISVTIPDSVTSIGHSAFGVCSRLANITIPDSVTSIGYRAFYSCDSLKSITIPDSVISIGQGAFALCVSLVSITVNSENDNFSSLSGVLFNKNKTKLLCYPAGKGETSYTVPDGVISIDAYAFSDCDQLESITIPDSVTSIGEYAFGDCSRLANITIPDSAVEINANFVVDTAYFRNTENWDEDGLYIGNHFIKAPSDATGKITIREGTKTIAARAAYQMGEITEISIPEGVVLIGSSAFAYTGISGTLFLPESLKRVAPEAFYDTLIDTVILSKQVEEIGSYAFDTYELTDIWFSGDESDRSNISIGFGAFSDDEWWHYNFCYDGHEYTNICDEQCNVCEFERQAHVFSSACDASCNECELERTPTEEHTYDSGCDSECNECRVGRTPIEEHTYDNDCDGVCNGCGVIRTVPDHVYGGNCDSECNKCGLERIPTEEHAYDNDCDSNCNGCGGIRAVPDHVYDNGCDSGCNVCHCYRIVPGHVYDNNCDINCNECGVERKTSHTYTEESYMVCTVCGHDRTSYTVSYHGNGEGGAPVSQTRLEGEPVRLASMSSSVYRFLGWSTTPTGTIAYRSGENYNEDRSITLYAKWGEHCYNCNDTGRRLSTEMVIVTCEQCYGSGKVNTSELRCQRCNSANWGWDPSNPNRRICKNCSSDDFHQKMVCLGCGGLGKTSVNKEVACTYCGGRGFRPIAQPDGPLPVLESKTATTVVLCWYEGVDYSKDGEIWQESNIFEHLDPETEYTFYIRYQGNSVHTIGKAGPGLVVTTNALQQGNAITSDKYTINETGISGIAAGTLVEELLSGLNEGSSCKVYKNDAMVSGDAMVGTGMTVKIWDGDTVKASYTAVVTGDLNGDGAVDAQDALYVLKVAVGKAQPLPEQKTAGDVNKDGLVNPSDALEILKKTVGKDACF